MMGRWMWILLLVTVGVVSGGSVWTGAQSGDLLDAIDAGAARWAAQQISDYTLNLQLIDVWAIQRVRAVVRGGRVIYVEIRCSPGMIRMPDNACHVDSTIAGGQYSVDWLFDQARDQAVFKNGRYTTIQIDDTYGFPSEQGVFDPTVTDSGDGIHVVSFLPGEVTLPDPWLDPVPEATPETTPERASEPLTPPADGDFTAWVADQQAQWEAMKRDTYRLTISAGGAWSALNLDLDVRGGRIEWARLACRPGGLTPPDGCQLDPVTLNDYTISGLFAYAGEIAALDGARPDMLQFDAEWHVPHQLVYDDVNMADEEWYVAVQGLSMGAPSEE